MAMCLLMLLLFIALFGVFGGLVIFSERVIDKK
jgi:hypothetical protein